MRMTWQKELKLEYCMKSFSSFTKDEINMVIDLYDEKDYYTYTKVAESKLIEKNILETDGVTLTENGDRLAQSIKSMLKLPKLNNVIKCWKEVRKSKGITAKKLSELSGVSVSIIAALESRIGKPSYRYTRYWAYIEDVSNIYKSLEMDMLLKFNEMSKQEKIEEAQRNKLESKKQQNELFTTNNTEMAVNKPYKQNISSDISKFKILISESPIETKLLKEIIKLNNTYKFEIDTQVDFSVNGRNYRAEIFIEFEDSNQQKRKILVECDGHDFHERTKEQAQKDKQRDRDFLSAGIITLRFTGSEIWKNAKKCAEEIFDTYNGFQAATTN